MPIFSAAPSRDLRSAIARAVATSNMADSPMLEDQASQASSVAARNFSLADQARAEVEQMRNAETARQDPRLAAEYAGNVAGMNVPDSTRLADHLRGVLEQPSAADQLDAAAGGLPEAQPFVTGAPNMEPGQQRMFQSALASTIANRLATGKTNAQELAQAGGTINKEALTNEAANAPDVPSGNRLIAAISGKLREPFKTNAEGTVINQETGNLNEGSQLAQVMRRLAGAKAAAEGAGGKPPAGYAWGANDAQGQRTLVPITGGPAAPVMPTSPGLTGDTFLNSIPSAKAAQVKALAEGRQQFPAGFALKSPYWQDMLSSVAQYDPTFDAVNYGARSATRADAARGTMAKSNNALTTGIGHVMQLSDAVEGLGNVGSMPFARTINAAKNVASKEFGGTGITDFQSVVNRVAPEITKIWRGAGGAEADIKRDIDSLSSSNTPEQLHSALRNIAGLMQSKLEANANQYQQGMGTTEKNIDFVTPQAKAQLELIAKRTGKGGAPAAAAPAATASATAPVNAKGWKLMKDAKGNQAYVSPDGKQAEELP